MTAERDSMTLNEVSYSALGAEERSDEAPRGGGEPALLLHCQAWTTTVARHGSGPNMH